MRPAPSVCLPPYPVPLLNGLARHPRVIFEHCHALKETKYLLRFVLGSPVALAAEHRAIVGELIVTVNSSRSNVVT